MFQSFTAREFVRSGTGPLLRIARAEFVEPESRAQERVNAQDFKHPDSDRLATDKVHWRRLITRGCTNEDADAFADCGQLVSILLRKRPERCAHPIFAE